MCVLAICGMAALLLLTDSLCTDSVHRLLSFGHCNTHVLFIVASYAFTTYVHVLCA